MKKDTEILADNLIEATKTSHQYILWAIWLGLFLFAMLLKVDDKGGFMIQMRESVTVLDIEVDASLGLIALVVSMFILGLMAYISIQRIGRIKFMLRAEPEIIKAALMFPSIPTIQSNFLRKLAILVPCLLYTVSLLIIFVPKLFDDDTDSYNFWGVFILIVFLNIPYIVLLMSLKKTLINLNYIITKEVAKKLKSELSEESSEKLSAIIDHTYGDFREFRNALEKLLITDEAEKKKIMTLACEHPYFDD